MKQQPLINNLSAATFIFVFIVYLSTVCPTVYVGDSGELTAAAYSLGIPHPSGYPLFALIGKIFCLIPVGSIGFRMNLMSAALSSATVLIVFNIIYSLSSSRLASVFGALCLAFTQVFWLQTVSAEVYPLHTFFVALLIRLLIYWDGNKSFASLCLFAFIVGLSFLNHLQTVMMAPAVLFFLIYSDRKGVLNPKSLFTISLFFLFALSAYVYLPLRTHAGAAIHWGDPDTFKNFWAVVSGSAHRSHYIFGHSLSYYITRSKDALAIVFSQFWIVIITAFWGFLKLPDCRWKIFYSLIIIFDFFYTIFLNSVFLEITAFNLPTLIVLSILSGIGISEILKKCKDVSGSGRRRVYNVTKASCCLIPVIFFVSNYNICDQSKNYIGYEHSLNAFRTVSPQGVLFADGDNNIFPMVYTRVIERMREDVSVYDLKNLFFRVDNSDALTEKDVSSRNTLLPRLQEEVVKKYSNQGVFLKIFDPYGIKIPEAHRLIPYGTLLLVSGDGMELDEQRYKSVWKYYSNESIEGNFIKDYMNREVAAYYHYTKGQYLLLNGGIELGLKRLALASEEGYNDEIIHVKLALLYTDIGIFNLAEQELEKALLYCDDTAMVYNNWGYYYSKKGDIDNAVLSIRKAVELNPNKTAYYNNLGSILIEKGNVDEAVKVLKKSISIDSNQEHQKEIVRKYESGKGM